MNVILRRWLWEAHGESRDLLCRRTGATPQFKACEIMLNLGFDDFKPS